MKNAMSSGFFATGAEERAEIRRREGWIIVAVLSIAVLVLFFTSPRNGGFFWSDAATFALNGELIRDYIAAGMPWSPMKFANLWFMHYPALTISLYPPIFPTAEAAVFALFGFSHSAAQATVAAFCGLAAYGGYRTYRTAGSSLAATGFVLAMFASPAILLWSRQVMMEVPSLAFLLIGSGMLLLYLERGSSRYLFLAVGMVLAAVYTKQTAIFAAIAFAATLLLDRGWALIRQRSAWIAAGAGVVGVLPLLVFTLVFQSSLLSIAEGTGSAAAAFHRNLPLAILYARSLPHVAGWVLLIGSAAYLADILIRGWRSASEKRLTTLMISWFVADFAFISLTAHFEERYAVDLVVPLAASCILLTERLLHPPLAARAGLSVGVVLFSFSVWAFPVPSVDGYADAARYVLNHTRNGEIILLDLDDTKSFVFALRSQTPSRKLYVLRAEKLLVNYSFLDPNHQHDLNLSRDEINFLLKKYGVSLAVMQPGFWINNPSMARLQSTLRSDSFSKISDFSITSSIADKQTTLEIFHTRTPTQPNLKAIRALKLHH